jgi:hypothetical protein
VVFLVPGDTKETEFDFCVRGFIEGNSADEAPDGFDVEIEPQKGELGGDGGQDDNFARAMVTVDGKSYIIQNNYWGNESGHQTLGYEGNSFEIKELTGGSVDGMAPASFPSIYIGQNGNKSLTTSRNDNLPAKISDIISAQTTVKWSGSGLGGSNMAYDIWFSKDNPPYGGEEYGDAVSGFAMLWLHMPDSNVPIGGSPTATANFCGHDWDVWAGDRGTSPEYPDLPSNRPVISYVVKGGDVKDFSCDLKEVFDDATSNNYNGKSLDSSWYLSDVFAGFEIWSGSPIGAKISDFTVDVKK